MAAGEQVALQPALAQLLRQHLHHPAVAVEVLVHRLGGQLPRLAGDGVDVVEPVRRRLVRPEQAEVAGPGVGPEDLGEPPAERPRGLGLDLARGRAGGGERGHRRQPQRAAQPAAVGLRGGPQPTLALGQPADHVGQRGPVGPEQLVGSVAPEPGLQRPTVLRIGADPFQRHLVGAPGPGDRKAVDLVRARPALGRAQHDHGPPEPVAGRAVAAGIGTRAGLGPDAGDGGGGPIEGVGQGLVDLARIVGPGPGVDHLHRPPLGLEQLVQLGVAGPGQERGVGDLPAVEVEDGQHRAVAHRVEEGGAVPAGGQGAGLGLAVAHDARHHQVGVVEGGAEGVGQRVAQLAPFVDRAGHGGPGVAGHAAGEREPFHQAGQADAVAGHVGVVLAEAALQPRRGDSARAAVAGSGHAQHVEVVGHDQPVEVGVDQVQPGRGAPVAEEAGLEVLDVERLGEQRVVEQVDLGCRDVVGGPPESVEAVGHELRPGAGARLGGRGRASGGARAGLHG